MSDFADDPTRFILDLPPMPKIDRIDLAQRITLAVSSELQLGRHQISVREAPKQSADGGMLFDDLRTDLERRRRARAEELYERHDFAATITAAAAWETNEDGTEWSRPVTAERTGKRRPSIWFSVRFLPDSAEPISAWDNLGHGTALENAS